MPDRNPTNAKEKNLGQFSKNKKTLPENLSLSSQKYGFRIRDPGSGKNLFWIPDPGPRVKKAQDPGSGSATPVFRPHGSRSVSTRYGSGFFYHQIVRKTLNPTVLFCDFFMTYLSLKNDVNVASKSNKPKNLEEKLIAVLKVADENSRIRIRIR